MRIGETARWYVFAIRATDSRRARYRHLIELLRWSDCRKRRRAADSLPGDASLCIEPAAGFLVTTPAVLPLALEVAEEASAFRAAETRSDEGHDHRPFLLDKELPSLDPGSAIARFAMDERVIGAVSQYLGVVPVLASIHVLLSPATGATHLSGSQLFHCDYEDLEQVKVFVYASDVGPDGGPLTVLPRRESARLRQARDYHFGGDRYRIPDDEMGAIGTSAVPVTGPAGTVVFVDTSQCLHFGSRVQPGQTDRLVIQFQYLTRTAFDFTFGGGTRAPLRPGPHLTPLQRQVLTVV